MNIEINETLKLKLKKIKCWLLDMDGTVSLENEALPGANDFFSAIADQDFIFLTNNSSRHADYYVDRMKKLGFDVNRSRMLTSTDALILYLKRQISDKVIRLNVIGTPDFERALTEAGFELVEPKGQQIDYVVVGFDTTLTYQKVDTACDYIRSGIPWVGANPDFVCPMADDKVLPDCGAIMEMLKACTSTAPEIVIGKPETAMVDMVIMDRGYKKEELAMVGDRLYTDLALARRAEIIGIAVLSGETNLDEINSSQESPDLVLKDIGELAAIVKDLGL
jgi:NagD protein